MRLAAVGLVLAAIAFLTSAVSSQHRDPAWYGTWELRVGRSKGESEGWAKQSTLLFTPDGWVESALGANGKLAGVAVALGSDGACIMIAAGPSQSCRYRFVDARHMMITLKGPGPMASTLNVRLLSGTTVEVVVEGTDFYGRSISGKEVWEKASSPRSDGMPNETPGR